MVRTRINEHGSNGWAYWGKRWFLGAIVYRGRLVVTVKRKPLSGDRRVRLWRLELAVNT